jgi:hypothetical protein
VKDENGDLLADSHNILNGWRKYFSQSLNVHRVSDIRQTEIHSPDLSPSDIQIVVPKLKKYKSEDSDQIPAELIQADGENLRFENLPTK